MPKNYWIVGASTGIGRALALALLARGDRVVVSARSRERLLEIAAEAGVDADIGPYTGEGAHANAGPHGATSYQAKTESAPGQRALGAACTVVPCDVTNAQSVAGAFAAASAALGKIDVAVLNAGTYTPASDADISVDSYRQVFDVNVLGVVRLLEHLVPAMQASGGGHIAMTSSLTGYIGLPHAAAYSATKAALISMAESLHSELAPSGIRVTVINPGFVDTPLTDRNDFPMPFLISPTAAAEAIVRGLDAGRFEVRFPWQMALIMRALRLLPYGLYFRLARRLVRHA